MVTGNGADGAADIDDFRGGEIGGERGENAAASHGKLDVAEVQKGVAAKKDLAALDGGDGAGGVDGGIALDENHPGHVAGGEPGVVGARSRRPALGGNEAIALELPGELMERGGLEPGEDERGFDRL